MTYNKFIELYCRRYNIEIIKVKRLSRSYGAEIKLLAYILRIKFMVSYGAIGTALELSRGVAMYCYYEVLGNSIWREVAENRYKEVISVRDVQENQ